MYISQTTYTYFSKPTNQVKETIWEFMKKDELIQ